MPYAIITFDKPDALSIRVATRDEHVAYLKANQHRLIAAGGLIEDDGTGGLGSILLVDTDDRADAEQFAADDPFTKAGLFKKTLVMRWRKAFFDGECLI
ncbi:MAG: YciI family protein [Burkholderiaceae bacterium]